LTNLITKYHTLPPHEQKKLNAKYLAWVSELPCCISGSVNVGRPHHLRYPGYCGMGMKPPDIFCVPITHRHHVLIHTQGRKTAERLWVVDFIDILTELHSRFMSETNFI